MPVPPLCVEEEIAMLLAGLVADRFCIDFKKYSKKAGRGTVLQVFCCDC
jgi:hypothetical protein